MKKAVFYILVLLPISFGIIQLFLSGSSPSDSDVTGQSFTSGPEQLVFMLQYLGTDYGAAVVSGKVESDFEYQEMLDFSQTLLERYQELSADHPQSTLSGLSQLQELIVAKAEWEKVRTLSAHLVGQLSQEFSLTSFPAGTPDIASGKRLFREKCVRCHGLQGGGDGPSVTEEEMEPPPRSFRDVRMNSVAPYQVFNAVTFGVEGTAMPSHEGLSSRERWDLSFYVFTLRKDFNPKRPPATVRPSLRELATSSNHELLQSLASGTPGVKMEQVDYLRRHPPQLSLEESLHLAGSKLRQSGDALRSGQFGQAADLSLEAYLEGIEPVESSLRVVDFALVDRLEKDFRAYRSALREKQEGKALSCLDDLMEALEAARRGHAAGWGGGSIALLQSVIIILREGVEAALLIALLLAFLIKAGRRDLQWYVFWGGLGGIVGGILTWALGRELLVHGGQREALEGWTSLLAAAVLFWVSLWIFHNLDVQRWKRYMKGQAARALEGGGGWFLAFAAFLAVFREAVETALFYQALWLRSSDSRPLIVVGFCVGVLLLGAGVTISLRMGVRLNLKPVFLVSGILLGLLSIMFAGYGVRELQNVGYLSQTPLDWMFTFSPLEIWPVRESLVLQLGIILSFLLGWQVARREARVASVKS